MLEELMKFERILWVEDNPGLSYFPICYNDARGPAFAKSFLDRTTVAFDLEMAKLEVSRSEFDLYILDADFPRRMKEERKRYVTGELESLRREPKVNRDFQFKPSWEADAMGEEGLYPGGGNEFRFLWRGCLQGKSDVVVFSISRDASYSACMRGLPFFYKMDKDFNPNEMTRNIEVKRRQFAPEDFPTGERIEEWVRRCGSAQKLTEEYLLA